MKHILGDRTDSTLYQTQGTKWMRYEPDEASIQPNAIDLRVSKIYRIEDGLVSLVGESKVHRPHTIIEPIQKMYLLTSGKYDVVFEPMIEVSEGEAGFLIQRSTLNRNGIILTSGLYDSGYQGIIGGCLHIPEGCTLEIYQDERLAQLILTDAESLHKYDGVYNAS